VFDSSLFRWLFTNASEERAAASRSRHSGSPQPHAAWSAGLGRAGQTAASQDSCGCSCGLEDCQLEAIMSREG